MAVEMKEMIAKAARTLLFEKKVKKLTVKDIVEECNITRQAFYYHFEDIPDLLQWEIERNSEKMMQECFAKGNLEEGIRYFMTVAINARPLVERGMKSNYGEELEKILTEVIYHFFEQVTEEGNLYQNYSRSDVKYILRYHSQAVMGILRNWNPEETKDIEHVAHIMYLLMLGKIDPFSKE